MLFQLNYHQHLVKVTFLMPSKRFSFSGYSLLVSGLYNAAPACSYHTQSLYLFSRKIQLWLYLYKMCIMYMTQLHHYMNSRKFPSLFFFEEGLKGKTERRMSDLGQQTSPYTAFRQNLCKDTKSLYLLVLCLGPTPIPHGSSSSWSPQCLHCS